MGNTLDGIMKTKKMRACTVCGVLRRYILNLASRGFDALATGHNIDDVAQAAIMNLLKNNFALQSRIGPVSGAGFSEKFTKKAKPLFFCSEKETLTYAYLNGLTPVFKECPYVADSFRLRTRDILNDIESKRPGAKRNIVDWLMFYTRGTGKKDGNFAVCDICGEPSAKRTCNACLLLKEILE